MKTVSLIKFAAIALTVGVTATAHAGLLGGGGLVGGGSIGGNLGGSIGGMGGLQRPIIAEGAGRSAVGALRDNAGSQVDATRSYGRTTAANARATGSAMKDLAGSVQGPDVASAAQEVSLGGSFNGKAGATKDVKEAKEAKEAKPAKE